MKSRYVVAIFAVLIVLGVLITLFWINSQKNEDFLQNEKPILTENLNQSEYSIEIENLVNKSCYALCRQNLLQTCIGEIENSEKSLSCTCTCKPLKEARYERLGGRKVINSNEKDWIEVFTHLGEYEGELNIRTLNYDLVRKGDRITFCYVNSSREDLAYAFYDGITYCDDMFNPGTSEELLKRKILEELEASIDNPSLNIKVDNQTNQMIKDLGESSQVKIQQIPVNVTMVNVHYQDRSRCLDAYDIYLVNEDKKIIGREYVNLENCD